jgi:RNA-binding protein YlmH
MPLGGWSSCLPPVRRARQAEPVPVQDMPKVFTFALVDVVSEDVKLSKGKARKAIARGKVTVNGVVVHDPDMRVDGMARIVYKP